MPRISIRILIAAPFLASLTSLAAPIPTPDLRNKTIIRREMMTFNPHYLALIGPRYRALRELEQQVVKRETELRDVSCSHQIVTELQWLIGSTVDTGRIDARLEDLRASLAHPELERRAREQDRDGSWGGCYDEWFFRLDASYGGHFSRGQGGRHIPLLDRVNSPQRLAQYVRSLSVSDVAHTGGPSTDRPRSAPRLPVASGTEGHAARPPETVAQSGHRLVGRTLPARGTNRFCRRHKHVLSHRQLSERRSPRSRPARQHFARSQGP